MKLKGMTIVSACALLALTACNKDQAIDTSRGYGDSPVSFASNIRSSQVRATDTRWDANDAIGIFMIRPSATINMANELPAKNKKYITADGGGAFAAATETDRILFPTDGSTMDFVAYYPYTTKWTGNLIDVNVADQSNPAAIDLLHSTNLKGVSASTPKENIKLVFTHQLSKLVFNLKNSDGSAVTGLNVTLKGFNTIGHFNISDGAVTPTESIKDITAKITNASVSAILMPGAATATSLYVQAGGKTYSYKLPQNLVLKKGTKLTFEATLHPDGTITVLEPDGTITDWTDEDGGNIDLVPDDGASEQLTLSLETLSLEATAATQTVTLTTTETQAWTATSNQNWLTVNPASGTGNASLSIQAQANDGEARSASISVVAGTTTKTITVNQAAKGGSGSETEQTIFRETYGWKDGRKVAKEGGKWPSLSSWTYWDNPSLSFTGEDLSLRAAGKLANSIWFAVRKDQVLTISGINTTGYKNIKVKFEITGNLYNAGASLNVNLIKVKIGDQTFPAPDLTITKEEGYNDKFYVATIEGLPADFTSMQFVTGKDNTIGIRLGAIELLGTK